MTTIQSEVIAENPPELPAVPTSPNASVTKTPAFPDAKQIIARVSSAYMEEDLMIRGYLEMGAELLEWSEAALGAQAEALPEE